MNHLSFLDEWIKHNEHNEKIIIHIINVIHVGTKTVGNLKFVPFAVYLKQPYFATLVYR